MNIKNKNHVDDFEHLLAKSLDKLDTNQNAPINSSYATVRSLSLCERSFDTDVSRMRIFR